MTSLFTWLNNATQFGVAHESVNEIKRRIVFSNVIFISLPIVYLIFMLIDYESFINLFNTFKFDQYIVPIVIIICLFCLWLNHVNHTILSRILFIISWPFLLHIIPIIIQNSPIDYTLALPIGIIFHSILIQLMISHSKERILFWVVIILNLLTLIYASDILIYASIGINSTMELITDAYYLLDSILYWLLFNLVMFYVILVLEEYISKVDVSYKLVKHQQSELKKLNLNLEEKVSQRTSELQLKNDKLTNYAHLNAHELNGSFCRIKGLLYLKSLNDLTSSDIEEINARLSLNIIELEITINKIQAIVNED